MLLLTPAAARLVTDIRIATRTGPARVARALRPYLTDPLLLDPDQFQPDPDQYVQHVLHVEPDGSFSLVALVWLPGQVTPVHDHVSWCVVGVWRGAEHETTYRISDDQLVPESVRISYQGAADYLMPPGDIHRVSNATDGLVVSLHIYGCDVNRLGSSIRRCYDLPIR
ncbi:hypothetical protein D5S17_24625 [Pseudonocardiaceae bacterium YIM PH 21723]|nr:hypothetical protein D5S17_24625 [Pseudonocardiaceae bacterium YIM PH 21723]